VGSAPARRSVSLPRGVTSPELELLDYKRRVHALYARVRAEPDPAQAFTAWVAERDDLFAHHPQSALPPERRARFAGLSYFPFDPRGRVLAEVTEAERRRYDVPSSDGEVMSFERVGVARFVLGDAPCELELYWLAGYGGGLFVPFADATGGDETYGAGRYLLDTVKGADLGTREGRLVLDFNLAYNPSCSYDPRWTCPLAPPPNRLRIPVRMGERHDAAH
jgi:uncharacterized protein (DUF1684 family)